jgi:hypothetical protein
LIDGGVFKYAWRLRASDDMVRTCEQGGVVGVVLSATNEADPAGAGADETDCDTGVGYSYGYEAGSYKVGFEAVDGNGDRRGEGMELSGQVVVAPNGVTDLGTIEIRLGNGP